MDNDNSPNEYDVAIVGGGIIGTSLLYALSKYSTVKKMALIEKGETLGQGVSHRGNNSQTLHLGDIETNYDKEKAAKVRKAGGYLKTYIEQREEEDLFRPIQKMVLAVGEQEVERLERRYEWLKDIFPEIKLLHRDALEKVEPNIVAGRDPHVPLCAIYNKKGHTVDYGAVAQSFAQEARDTETDIDTYFGLKVGAIEKHEDGGYDLLCEYTGKQIRAKVVVFAVGAASLRFAHRFGYKREWILLPVAGSFFRTKKQVEGKVYMMQLEGIPFAAIHADPSFSDPDETHFGPLAKVLPMLERGNYETVLDFFKLFRVRIDAFLSLLSILSQKIYLFYIIKQVLYDIPHIGKWAFLREARKIIPSLTAGDIHPRKKKGGIRPQIVNTKTRTLQLGEARILGENVIFDITPSPGASVSLDNASKGAQQVVEFLGGDFSFDKKAFEKDHTT